MNATKSALHSVGIPLAPKAGSPALPIHLHQQVDLEARTISTSAAPRVTDPTPPRTITDADHENILSLIRHQCRTFERAPDAFAKLDEEHLRDVIRSSLNAVYRVASAEAFRSRGALKDCAAPAPPSFAVHSVHGAQPSRWVTASKSWKNYAGLVKVPNGCKSLEQAMGISRDPRVFLENENVSSYFASILLAAPRRAVRRNTDRRRNQSVCK